MNFNGIISNILPTWPIVVAGHADKILSKKKKTITVVDLSSEIADKIKEKEVLGYIKEPTPATVLTVIKRVFHDPKELRQEVERTLKYYKKLTLQDKHQYIKPDNYKKIIW